MKTWGKIYEYEHGCFTLHLAIYTKGIRSEAEPAWQVVPLPSQDRPEPRDKELR